MARHFKIWVVFLFWSLPLLAGESVRVAVLGDFGLAGLPLADVTRVVRSWSPDVIVTVGDNNYPSGDASTMEANVGQYFGDYVRAGRFFPTLGNHDWNTPEAKPYLDYFKPPGNGRYYDIVAGPIHFFMLDSDKREPDGRTEDSVQATWLKPKMLSSKKPWKIVLFHHAPYSSGPHGPTKDLQWPFSAWGASAVVAGHDHTYERLMIEGIPYFVNGAGGAGLYKFKNVLPESQVRFSNEHGALRIDATEKMISFGFFTRYGRLVDQFHRVAVQH
jgi:tartrate-resistant acid phosphatase type 5